VRGQCHALAAPYPQKDPVPIVQEAGWATGPVWTGAENLTPHQDSIPVGGEPVGSHYTNYAIWPTNTEVQTLISFSWIFPQADVAQGLTYTQTRTPTHIGVIQFGSL